MCVCVCVCVCVCGVCVCVYICVCVCVCVCVEVGVEIAPIQKCLQGCGGENDWLTFQAYQNDGLTQSFIKSWEYYL